MKNVQTLILFASRTQDRQWNSQNGQVIRILYKLNKAHWNMENLSDLKFWAGLTHGDLSPHLTKPMSLADVSSSRAHELAGAGGNGAR